MKKRAKAPLGKPAKTRKAAKPGKPPKPKYIVGIGASAGGLEALRSLFGALKQGSTMAFVVVQHLAPTHRSRLVELIAHSTPLRVKEVQDGEAPQPGVICVTPPGKDVFYEGGLLRLREPQLTVGPKPSIDLFFHSLADNGGDAVIGIVLSGTGSDGAHGIRAIKAAGGLTISQQAQSAKYDGMPKAAKMTGSVDLELTPERIADELARLERLDGPRGAVIARPAASLDIYQEILSVVTAELGVDFADYKPSTIHRRIERRMVANRCESLRAYHRYLSETPAEAKLLFQDILISVTSFFRDHEAFKALSARLTQQIRGKPQGAAFRAWSIGCATGEEAYSIAILVSEILDKLKKPIQVQIFATDLDDQALAIARKGIYSKASFAEFPPELIEKYFNHVDERLQIKSSLRDWIIFARHNVTEDPPFINQDLVTCRNLLIYFNGKLQARAFNTIHYALDRGGTLFLGRSEAVPSGSPFFEIVDKHAKLYLRLERKGDIPRSVSRHEASREAALISKEKGGASVSSAGSPMPSLIAALAPNSILVDSDFKLIHVYGSAGELLRHPVGEATQSVAKLLPS
jgi:two-component system CheB/CheR fusion protein